MKGQWKKIAARCRATGLMTRIAMGIAVGTLLALICPGLTPVAVAGTLFVGALKAIAPLLVAVLVVSSVARARGGLGGRFRTVVSLYVLSTLLAAVLAATVGRIWPPELVLKGVESAQNAAPGRLADVFHTLARDIMSNPLAAIGQANYLSVLFWAVITGLALKATRASTAIQLCGELAGAVSKMVKWVIACAPIGIMGLVYGAVTESGPAIFTTYGRLVVVLVGCMLTVSVVLNPLIAGLLLRRNPYPLLWKCLRGSAVSAFFTRSSAANIPVNMALCKRLGLDEDFYAVSIPLGATINMNGAAVTITVMTMAACATLGIEVSAGSAIVLSMLAALGACGASGVAGGSLLLIPMACSLFGISNDIAMQVVAVGFIVGVVQDSVETALNSSGDAFFTATAEFCDRSKRP